MKTPPHLLSTKLELEYNVKIKSCPTKSAYRRTFGLNYWDLFWKKDNDIQLNGLRMKSIVEDLGTTLSNVQEMTVASIPWWTIKQHEVLLELHISKKKKKEKKAPLPGYVSGHVGKLTIYAVVSKCEGKIECVSVSKNIIKEGPSQRETLFSLQSFMQSNISTLSSKKKILIFSDSRYVLSALKKKKTKKQNPFITKISKWVLLTSLCHLLVWWRFHSSVGFWLPASPVSWCLIWMG